MAFTLVTNTNAADKTAGTSKTYLLSSGNSQAIGDLMVLILAMDNAGTNGAAPTVTDIQFGGVSQPWALQASGLQDPGAASDGAAVQIFTWVATAAVASGSITVTTDVSVTAGAIIFYRFTTDGGTLSFTAATASAGAPPSDVGISGNAVGDLFIGGAAQEGTAAVSGDLDTDGGAWTTIRSNATAGGSATTNMRVAAQTKITSSAVDQFWRAAAMSGDGVVTMLRIREGATAPDRRRRYYNRRPVPIMRAVR